VRPLLRVDAGGGYRGGMIPLLLFMFACDRSACVQVDVSNPNHGDGGAADDTGTPPDTGDGGGSTDDQPCDVPEVEPNSPIADAMVIPMEQWACGTFSDASDLSEVLFFQNTEPGWIRVWSRAFDIGSLADLTLTLSSDEGTFAASRLSNPDSTDAEIIFPIEGLYGFYATLNEQYSRSGKAYYWELMGSMVKAPVEWTSTESASNDSRTTADPVADGDRIYGLMDSTIDYDWYSLEVPEGRTDIVLDIDAWFYGSPADTRIELYKPDGTLFRSNSASNREGFYDLDPYLSTSLTEPGVWTFKVMPEIAENGSGGGGRAFWYVLDVSTTSE